MKNTRRNFNTHEKDWKINLRKNIQKIESKGKKIENRRERIKKVGQSRGMLNKSFKKRTQKTDKFFKQGGQEFSE